jgi:hypothetical protein
MVLVSFVFNCCVTFQVFVIMADGAVPDVLSVASRIDCVSTRYCIEYLASCMSRVEANQSPMMSLLAEINGNVKEMKLREEGSSRLWPLPPLVIQAVSRPESATSGSLPGSSSSSSGYGRKRGRKVSLSDHDVWVKCPFCHQQHWNEKCHVQHVKRSVER